MDPVSASYGAYVAPAITYSIVWFVAQIVMFVVLIWATTTTATGSNKAQMYKTLLGMSHRGQKMISVDTSRFSMLANATHPPWRGYRHRLVCDKPAIFVNAPTNPRPDKAVVYIHGGGLIFGGVKACEWICSQIADATSTNVYIPHYRLCPEHTADDALRDCIDTYNLIKNKYDDVAIVADSAGGYLAYGVASYAETAKRPTSSITLISPMLNLHEDLRNVHSDESFSSHAITWCMNNVRASTLSALSWVTPTAPLMIIVADDEMMMDDVQQLHEVRPDATVWSYKGVFHAFPKIDIPESHNALAKIAEFVG